MEGQFADTVILAGGPQTYEPFVWKSFRFLKLRFHAVNGPITVCSVRAQVSTYPYEERGLFQSSDATLNAVWDISRYTLRLCSNEFLMDTPWREQAQWLGDVAAVTVPGIYACFGDPRLPAKFLRQAAANQHSTGLIANISNAVEPAWQHDIPDYSLWWVMALWNHYLYTGEADWIHELYPVAVRIMQTHFAYVNEHGLIEDMPYWVFIDWADVDRRGECAALNAIFHGALEALEKMAAFKRDDYWREKASAARTAIAANFQKRLFDAPRGVFADARVDDRLSPKISEHANLAAIRWGLADAAAAQSILDRLYGPQPLFFTEAQPFFMVVVLQALARLGRHDLALKLIRDRWGQRMVAQGATSCHEEWGINGSWRSGEYAGFLRTLSHAWSACPAEFLIKDLMGLEILEPGCAKVCLRPVKTPFDYKLAYPTPRGVIAVECRNGDIKMTVPTGVVVLQ
ncbi:MAG: hypothetical protein FJ278_17350 [Planctomycetes bacterium]|nr:hypothetical protein [Planctomycetota bacterium]